MLLTSSTCFGSKAKAHFDLERLLKESAAPKRHLVIKDDHVICCGQRRSQRGKLDLVFKALQQDLISHCEKKFSSPNFNATHVAKQMHELQERVLAIYRVHQGKQYYRDRRPLYRNREAAWTQKALLYTLRVGPAWAELDRTISRLWDYSAIMGRAHKALQEADTPEKRAQLKLYFHGMLRKLLADPDSLWKAAAQSAILKLQEQLTTQGSSCTCEASSAHSASSA